MTAIAEPRAGRLIYLLLASLTAFAPITTDIYVPAMPEMQRTFAASSEMVQLTLSTFFVGYALGQLFYGPISDRYGRKPPLYAGLVVFIATSAGCALAPTIEWVVALRFLEALGACAGSVIARAIVTDLFAGPEAARAFAVLTMVMGAAPIVSPSIGAWLLTWFGWGAIFWALALFGAVCLAGTWLGLPETHPSSPDSALDLRSVAARYRSIGTDRRFVIYCLAGALGMGGMFAYIAGSPFVFIGHYRFAPNQYGLLFGLNSSGIIAAAQVNRMLLRKRRPEALVRGVVLVELVLGAVLLAVALADPRSAWLIAVPLFFYLNSIGFVFPNATALAMSAFRQHAGAASALLGSVQSSLAAATAILVGAIGGESAVPMAIIIAAYGVLAVWATRRLPA